MKQVSINFTYEKHLAATIRLTEAHRGYWADVAIFYPNTASGSARFLRPSESGARITAISWMEAQLKSKINILNLTERSQVYDDTANAKSKDRRGATNAQK